MLHPRSIRLTFSLLRMPTTAIGPDLLAGCLANRRAAQRELYDRSLPYLSGIARRYLRNEGELKDVLQETYCQVFQKLNQYDAAQAAFLTWAGRITINNCLKRNEKTLRLTTEELCPQTHAEALPPEALARLNEADLRRWLRRMPTDLHTVFLLYTVDGFTHKEIAGMLTVDPALSRQRLRRARKWLARELEANDRQTGKVLPFPRQLPVAPFLLTVYAFIHHLP